MTTEVRPDLLTFGELTHLRLFRIPSYQRAYSWQGRQRKELFEDLDRTWEAGDGRQHFMSTIVGLLREKRRIIVDEHQVIDIVDGQQRLTTLVILLKGVSKALDRGDETGQRLGREIDEVLVKPDAASLLLLQTNHDSSNFFADYLRNGTVPRLSVAKTLADRELLRAIRDCEAFVSRWRRKASLIELIALLRNRLTFIFHGVGDEGVVYSVFEVLNSRGLSVSHFDRLKSMLMAIIFDSKSENHRELIDEIHDVWGEIYQLIGLNRGIDSQTLQCAATLRSSNRPSRPLSEEAAVDALVEQSNDDPAEVVRISTWLKSVAQAVTEIANNKRRNTVARIFQARLLAVSIDLRPDLSDAEKEKLLGAWESVSFRLYGLKGLDARWMIGDYVRLAWDVTNRNYKADELLERILNIGSGFPIEKVIEEIRGGDWYSYDREDLRYFLYRYEEYLAKKAGQKFNNAQWNRIWETSAADSIDHILPQSSGEEGHVHRVGNLVLLPPKLNSQLGAKNPQEKADAYQKTGLLHVQEVVACLSRWNNRAIEKREKELLQWAAQEWADPA